MKIRNFELNITTTLTFCKMCKSHDTQCNVATHNVNTPRNVKNYTSIGKDDAANELGMYLSKSQTKYVTDRLELRKSCKLSC